MRALALWWVLFAALAVGVVNYVWPQPPALLFVAGFGLGLRVGYWLARREVMT